MKDHWDIETAFPEIEIVQNATDQYNNMVAVKYLNKTDPKYAKTLALTTHLYQFYWWGYGLF